ncbi:autotransporter adhesin family protein [Paenarthrobacter sp. PAE-2]|uniref:autotransporter adhesin family protein n=1 Tax=Paenarthrobacter sp. PAE-2 TaxID=2982532 RepID=UPI00222F54D8|nr:autotransporter adhesin family protein [Paenarthrobacter sp. PAE-2]MCW3766476.1 autotransporter adhesin family protein [Paenarthrobacter sp. PAE-2]
MVAIDNMADPMRAIQALVRRVERLENNTNQNRSAIGRGGLSVYDGGMITIENGGLRVTGSAEIIGTLNANGTINMTGIFIASGEMQLNGTTVATGEFNIDGPLLVDGNTTFNGELTINGITNITGDTTVTGKLVTDGPVDINGLTNITGDLEVSGTMDINGAATLNNDLTVAEGRKIKLGGLTLENTGTGGGTLNFPNGSVSSSTALGMLLASGVAIELAAPVLKVSGMQQISGVTPNVYLDNTGNLKKIV